jgi:hypothetical protein
MGGSQGFAAAMIEKQRGIGCGEPRAATKNEPSFDFTNAQVLVPAELREGVGIKDREIRALKTQRAHIGRNRTAELRGQGAQGPRPWICG